ncbi:hypothetical protein [Mycobacterium pseudokansasii]|uniref:hypothetical protein n=1 Tax=Mycobacterium pseudokansasii TaxID=2341080 RepID=UPI001B7D74C5|nr:hypothetical protein [Mycobacterium pseudokansasii]
MNVNLKLVKSIMSERGLYGLPRPGRRKPNLIGVDTPADLLRQLCDTYKLAARAVQVETTGSDRVLARVALTNAAAMLDNAAADPALDARHRDAARSLAKAYRTTTAMGSVATETEYRAALDDIIAKDAQMRQACANGGG